MKIGCCSFLTFTHLLNFSWSSFSIPTYLEVLTLSISVRMSCQALTPSRLSHLHTVVKKEWSTASTVWEINCSPIFIHLGKGLITKHSANECFHQQSCNCNQVFDYKVVVLKNLFSILTSTIEFLHFIFPTKERLT